MYQKQDFSVYNTLKEAVNNSIRVVLNEMGMKRSKMRDKFGEVIGTVVDNLAAILLYPDNPTVSHWKDRVMGLCNRFINIDMVPLRNNNYSNRKSVLSAGVSEELNNDYSAIKNHIRSVADYYANKSDEKERIFPAKAIEDCITDYYPVIKDAVNKTIECVAKQDNAELTRFVENF